MRTFEITTPALLAAVDACNNVLTGAIDGPEAGHVIGASNATVKAVNAELAVRLAAPKLAAIEAKLVEAETQKKIS